MHNQGLPLGLPLEPPLGLPLGLSLGLPLGLSLGAAEDLNPILQVIQNGRETTTVEEDGQVISHIVDGQEQMESLQYR